MSLAVQPEVRADQAQLANIQSRMHSKIMHQRADRNYSSYDLEVDTFGPTGTMTLSCGRTPMFHNFAPGTEETHVDINIHVRLSGDDNTIGDMSSKKQIISKQTLSFPLFSERYNLDNAVKMTFASEQEYLSSDGVSSYNMLDGESASILDTLKSQLSQGALSCMDYVQEAQVLTNWSKGSDFKYLIRQMMLILKKRILCEMSEEAFNFMTPRGVSQTITAEGGHDLVEILAQTGSSVYNVDLFTSEEVKFILLAHQASSSFFVESTNAEGDVLKSYLDVIHSEAVPLLLFSADISKHDTVINATFQTNWSSFSIAKLMMSIVAKLSAYSDYLVVAESWKGIEALVASATQIGITEFRDYGLMTAFKIPYGLKAMFGVSPELQSIEFSEAICSPYALYQDMISACHYWNTVYDISNCKGLLNTELRDNYRLSACETIQGLLNDDMVGSPKYSTASQQFFCGNPLLGKVEDLSIKIIERWSAMLMIYNGTWGYSEDTTNYPEDDSDVWKVEFQKVFKPVIVNLIGEDNRFTTYGVTTMKGKSIPITPATIGTMITKKGSSIATYMWALAAGVEDNVGQPMLLSSPSGGRTVVTLSQKALDLLRLVHGSRCVQFIQVDVSNMIARPNLVSLCEDTLTNANRYISQYHSVNRIEEDPQVSIAQQAAEVADDTSARIEELEQLVLSQASLLDRITANQSHSTGGRPDGASGGLSPTGSSRNAPSPRSPGSESRGKQLLERLKSKTTRLGLGAPKAQVPKTVLEESTETISEPATVPHSSDVESEVEGGEPESQDDGESYTISADAIQRLDNYKKQPVHFEINSTAGISRVVNTMVAVDTGSHTGRDCGIISLHAAISANGGFDGTIDEFAENVGLDPSRIRGREWMGEELAFVADQHHTNLVVVNVATKKIVPYMPNQGELNKQSVVLRHNGNHWIPMVVDPYQQPTSANFGVGRGNYDQATARDTVNREYGFRD